MRKNIFEIAKESISQSSEVRRIIQMSTEEKIITGNGHQYTLFDFVQAYCFDSWKQRGHFIDSYDFLRAINYEQLITTAQFDEKALFTYIELVYNFFWLASAKMKKTNNSFRPCGDYGHLHYVMDDILGSFNHIAYLDKENERVLVVEDKPEVTAVAEIVENNLATDIIKYNHFALKGNLELKKAILFKMNHKLEPQWESLKAIDFPLKDNISFVLNNLNIRHNNETGKKQKTIFTQMKDSDLEKWYDELYQMLLLAFLLLDNQQRNKQVEQLRKNTKFGGKS